MNLETLTRELDALERDERLFDEERIADRRKAVELERLFTELARSRGDDPVFTSVKSRAEALAGKAVRQDEELFARTNGFLRSFRGRFGEPETRRIVRSYLDRFTGYRKEHAGKPHYIHDGLDLLMDGVLEIGRFDGFVDPSDPEMVQYQDAHARVILDLVDTVPVSANDVFYEIGAGLGRAAILFHILTGLPVKAVEIDERFCAFIRESTGRLGITGVEAVNADARNVEYRNGTIFFLFTPFRGTILDAFLRKLTADRAGKPTTVCTAGPCTTWIRETGLLVPRDADRLDEFALAVYDIPKR